MMSEFSLGDQKLNIDASLNEFSVGDHVLNIDGSQIFERAFFKFRTVVKVRIKGLNYSGGIYTY